MAPGPGATAHKVYPYLLRGVAAVAWVCSGALGFGRRHPRDQRAQRTRLDVDHAAQRVCQSAGRNYAGAAMEFFAQSIWLATAVADTRTGIDGLSLHVQRALDSPPCDGTACIFADPRPAALATRALTAGTEDHR